MPLRKRTLIKHYKTNKNTGLDASLAYKSCTQRHKDINILFYGLLLDIINIFSKAIDYTKYIWTLNLK